MKKNKICCNATNSAAIDKHGNLYLWGSGKHGLLGRGKQSTNQVKP